MIVNFTTPGKVFSGLLIGSFNSIKFRKILSRSLFYAVGLIPFLLLILDFYSDRLTAEPIQEAMHRTGKYTLVLLLITLSCTPLKHLTGIKVFLYLRKTAGLLSFSYATLHAVIFFIFDYGLDFFFIKEALFEKPYALMGLFSYILLIPLAATSNHFFMRRLGKFWKNIHSLIYVLTAAGIFHFIWLVKSDYRIPLMYGLVFVFLMAYRVLIFIKKNSKL
ncbi:MAG: sulfoxide reductase heme-binding subunit YedZ [Spirochaetia bacterium]|nr:sulfoxide reductase heme-binding subunit YedZ [Spirochaetia bacterium]